MARSPRTQAQIMEQETLAFQPSEEFIARAQSPTVSLAEDAGREILEMRSQLGLITTDFLPRIEEVIKSLTELVEDVNNSQASAGLKKKAKDRSQKIKEFKDIERRLITSLQIANNRAEVALSKLNDRNI